MVEIPNFCSFLIFRVQYDFYFNQLIFFQVLLSGATECPTKPKGRPRKNSYYPTKTPSLSAKVELTPVLSPMTVDSRQSSEDSLEHEHSNCWGSCEDNFSDEQPTKIHRDSVDDIINNNRLCQRPESPTISVTDWSFLLFIFCYLILINAVTMVLLEPSYLILCSALL